MLIGIAPQALADFGVKDFREALREAIGKCLQQDVRIVVMGFLEPFEMRLQPVNRGAPWSVREDWWF